MLIYLIWVIGLSDLGITRYNGELLVFCQGQGTILGWFSMSGGMKGNRGKCTRCITLLHH